MPPNPYLGRQPRSDTSNGHHHLSLSIAKDIVTPMIQSLLLSLWVLGIGSAASACAPPADYVPIAQQPQQSLLYKTVSCAGEEDYIFGTFHTSDAQIIEGVIHILPYLEKATHAYFEILPSADDATTATRYMLLPADHAGLDIVLGADYFARLSALLQKHQPEAAQFISRYTPWAASLLLQVSMIDMSGEVMDNWLQRKARSFDITIHALETMESQFNAFMSLSQTQQLTMLRDTIDTFDALLVMNEQLVTLYKARDLKAIQRLGDDAFDAMPDSAIATLLRDALITKRNHAMVVAIDEAARKATIFTAVGALHLSGKDGILQLLEDKGYRIYPIQ